jgi:hypothetical protein
MAVSSIGADGIIGMPMPSGKWGESILAGLPHLLMGVILVSWELVSPKLGIDQDVLNISQLIIFPLLLVGSLVLFIVNRRKRWSASWIFYVFLLAVAVVSVALNELSPQIIVNNAWSDDIFLNLILLLLAYLLYKIACKDRLHGLLAAIAPMAFIWMYFLEFVPTLQRSLAWGWIFALAFVAAVMMLHPKQFSTSLGLAMSVPILGGLPFAYLGVYLGGTLPFSEPGPSMLEVFRQYIPFLAMTLTIILGPQLAVKLRALSRQSAEAGGRVFYRLVLGGTLLGLIYVILQWITISSSNHILLIIGNTFLIAGVILYLTGYALLFWASFKIKRLTHDNHDVIQLAALFIPLLFVPLIMFLALPISTGDLSRSWMVSTAMIIWVVAAVWMVKD